VSTQLNSVGWPSHPCVETASSFTSGRRSTVGVRWTLSLDALAFAEKIISKSVFMTSVKVEYPLPLSRSESGKKVRWRAERVLCGYFLQRLLVVRVLTYSEERTFNEIYSFLVLLIRRLDTSKLVPALAESLPKVWKCLIVRYFCVVESTVSRSMCGRTMYRPSKIWGPRLILNCSWQHKLTG